MKAKFRNKVEGHVFNKVRVFGYRVFKKRENYIRAYRKLYEEQIIPYISRGLSAAVYTQLSDVEDEINGLLTFDREILKLTTSDIADINEQMKQIL